MITQAGATYVPQLAQTLQTEQVIPPGAAPNGTGPGGHTPPGLSSQDINGINEGVAETLAEQKALEFRSRVLLVTLGAFYPEKKCGNSLPSLLDGPTTYKTS